MGALHLFNCVVLGLGPLAMMWKGRLEAVLVETAGLCASLFFVSQLLQMILIATFVPETQEGEVGWAHEASFCTARIVDLVALNILFDQKKLKELAPSTQVEVVGLCWAMGDAVTKMLAISKASAPQFTSAPLVAAFSINLNLLIELAFAGFALSWVSSKERFPVIPSLFILFRCCLPSILSAAQAAGVSGIQLLMLHGAMAVCCWMACPIRASVKRD
eukprot:TRINITY_DN13785_c0_g1_i6.p1 TRINITY_DN13785_c0_g1~~TRINITY_DN13785_c0_g1_i6.p1  ORF type:complete len:240 (+),score=36.59 TRINITY_DN13785_c0_g1_i6:67-720(+)